MIEIKEYTKFKEIIATEGYLHKIGDKDYSEYKRKVLLKSESINDYEEILELPKYTHTEYKTKVVELIREKYSVDEEYKVQREAINILLNPMSVSDDNPKQLVDFNEYNRFVENCKIKAKEELSNG